MDKIIQSTTVRFDGLYASDGLIELNQLGTALRGLSKIGNTINHFAFYGEVISDQRLYRVKYFTGPPRPGSVVFELAAMMANSQLPLFPGLAGAAAKMILPPLWKALLDATLGRMSAMDRAMDIIQEQSRQHHELAMTNADMGREMLHAQMADKAWLQDHISKMAEQTRPAFREAAAPVGEIRSCRKETVWPEAAEPTEIDEPAAQVLRSRGGLELGEMMHSVAVRVRRLDLDTGHGRADMIDDGERPVTLRVTDPALKAPHNVYSRALDTQGVLTVTAKPTLKDGQISSLYVSDGALAD